MSSVDTTMSISTTPKNIQPNEIQPISGNFEWHSIVAVAFWFSQTNKKRDREQKLCRGRIARFSVVKWIEVRKQKCLKVRKVLERRQRSKWRIYNRNNFPKLKCRLICLPDDKCRMQLKPWDLDADIYCTLRAFVDLNVIRVRTVIKKQK